MKPYFHRISQIGGIVKMSEQNNCKDQTDYFIGLDIGTDSVGYAVVNSDYSLAKFKGEPMWGAMLFESAENCKKRRQARTFRRRLARRQQRVDLIQRLFYKEIAKSDPNFFLRLNESALCKEDRSPESLVGCNWDDKDYHKRYPTIHHLICALMESAEGKDIRLLYLACAWLVAHRGHFLNPAEPDNVDKLLNMAPLYEDFETWFKDNEYELPWESNAETLAGELKKQGITRRKEGLQEALFAGKKPPKKEEKHPFDYEKFLNLLAGGKVDINSLFGIEDSENAVKITLSDNDSVDDVCNNLEEENARLLRIAKNMYDCGSLIRILAGSQANPERRMISEVKVEQYNQHKQDLKELKELIKRYPLRCEKRNFFCKKDEGYTSYIQKGNRDEFYKSVKKLLESQEDSLSEEDQKIKDSIRKRIEDQTYMPRQVHSDNGNIPYQLYYIELKKILENAEKEFPFLLEKDVDGKTVSDKILSVFTFKIPYYVGPLSNVDKHGSLESSHAWICRKEAGDIFPWNFEQKVDLEECQRAFIEHLTGKCTYLPGERVLPQDSLLYSKYKILNEINPIKVDGRPISVELKQEIFGLFKKHKKVKFEHIKNLLISRGILSSESPKEKISGIDPLIKSQYRPYHDFKKLMEKNLLTEEKVEEIICHFVCMEDTKDRIKWLKKEYGHLPEEDLRYLSRLKYQDFGNLSARLLNGFEGTSKTTGEYKTVLHFLWESNDNLMQILEDPDRYDFKERLEKERSTYYSENERNLADRLEDLYLSNPVKRQILRTLDVVADILHAKKGHQPKKIFIEMARDNAPDKKGKRTKTRKDQLEILYNEAKKNPDLAADIENIRKELSLFEGEASRKLKQEKLFLYFCQLGKCMYCGKPLSLGEIENERACDIDHIWPQAKIKDDSLDNLVLVHSEENRKKSATYPLPSSCQAKMKAYWYALRKANLISEKKLNRLIRTNPFTAEEQLGFIARQLVETRQSTKVIAQLLKEQYKNSEIVYVKAGTVSDFRHEYGAICKKAFSLSEAEVKQRELIKCRTANDAHHAHDAYLNVVVGNVFDERFSKKWFSIEHDKYSLNYDALFGQTYWKRPEIWDPKTHLPNVDRTMATCAVHLTKYAQCQKGIFFKLLPEPAPKNDKKCALIPRKQGLDPQKYGGYNNPTVSFYVLAAYRNGKKKELSLVSVRLLEAERFLASSEFAQEYIKKELGEKATDIVLPLGKRILKINTVFSLDSFTACLSGRTGNQVLFRSLQLPYYSPAQMRYIKKVEKIGQKLEENKNYSIDEQYDGISAEENLRLFDALAQKIDSDLFRKIPGSGLDMNEARKQNFKEAEKETQIECLKNMLLFLKTNRYGSCSMESVKGKKNEGLLLLSANLSNWKKRYSDVRILDRSAAGLHEKRSQNLLTLLDEDPKKETPSK